MIKSVRESSEVKKGQFARPERTGSPDKKFNYGSSKQNKDYRGKKSKSSFSPR